MSYTGEYRRYKSACRHIYSTIKCETPEIPIETMSLNQVQNLVRKFLKLQAMAKQCVELRKAFSQKWFPNEDKSSEKYKSHQYAIREADHYVGVCEDTLYKVNQRLLQLQIQELEQKIFTDATDASETSGKKETAIKNKKKRKKKNQQEGRRQLNEENLDYLDDYLDELDKEWSVAIVKMQEALKRYKIKATLEETEELLYFLYKTLDLKEKLEYFYKHIERVDVKNIIYILIALRKNQRGVDYINGDEVKELTIREYNTLEEPTVFVRLLQVEASKIEGDAIIDRMDAYDSVFNVNATIDTVVKSLGLNVNYFSIIERDDPNDPNILRPSKRKIYPKEKHIRLVDIWKKTRNTERILLVVTDPSGKGNLNERLINV